MTPVRDAATVMIVRDASEGPQVFMVRRGGRAAWLPDFYVFPGGALEAADRSAEARERSAAFSDEIGPYAFAAARETFEEVGLLFADRDLPHGDLAEIRARINAGETTFIEGLASLHARVDLARLRYFSRWITPPEEPRRFDARFFIARAPEAQLAEADAAEVHDGRWVRPADALAAHARGEIGMIFPTIKHLERIAPYADVEALLAFASEKPIVTVSPTVAHDAISMAPELENAW